MEKLRAARDTLRCCLEVSKELSADLGNAKERLKKTNQRLALLESCISKISKKCSLYNKIKDPLAHTIHLSDSILKMFQLVSGLENTLLSSDPSSGLWDYLDTVKRSGESLRFLTGYCRLAIPWLEQVESLLEEDHDNPVADEGYLGNVKKFLETLGEVQAMEERFWSKGGSLVSALDKLEGELATLLMGDTNMIDKVHAIVERLAANNRRESCVSVYVEIRSSFAREALQELGLDYLETPLNELESLQSVENTMIDQWGMHLEFAVKYVFEIEHNLCREIFQKNYSEIFARIVSQSGIQSFFEFAKMVAKGKKEAIKLLKLLEIFAVLEKLRLDFNRLFKGKACRDIQNQTRDLIKRVVNGACEIFWELPLQVELQQLPSPPPGNCGVPRLAIFVTGFCNLLLEDDYWSTLLQVLEIHQGWAHKEFNENLLTNEIHNIMTALEKNLEAQARAYVDPTLSSLFLINANQYLSEYTRGTKLCDIMGDQWITRHEENMEHYIAIYLKESWEKLKDEEDFGDAFERICKIQSGVLLCDKGLRWRICEAVLHAVLPLFIEKYASQVVDIKYTPERVERMIRCLFQPELEEFGAANLTKCTELISKVNSVVANPICSTPTAA
ncbi:unnamed protein product [Cuscuta campestris]|uniref:Exocyst subunit Exo70 family protein n=1 Tax=Cuscuta campestris TaxID=132261 RepID=A0A484KJM4_9ASTE|nr:unnamed protein product [Cuscuta campestris]